MTKNSFKEYLAGLTTGFTPVIDAGFSVSDYMPLDLSVANQELSNNELVSSEDFERWLQTQLKSCGKKIAYGGYNEKRDLYRRSDLFSQAENEDQVRNIHLGIDLWAPEGTAVHAVLDGTIHSFKDNRNFGDYGPTIILQHEREGGTFFTLYGHLSRTSLEGLKAGQSVKGGQRIAELGKAAENGDYAPHLHFQVITDLNGNSGDYPGVTSRFDLQDQLKNCPDPNLLLKIPKSSTGSLKEKRKSGLLKEKREHKIDCCGGRKHRKI